MSYAYQQLSRIIAPSTPIEQRVTAIRSFARELHWTPSYELSKTFGIDGAQDHIVVEHGLENSAAISFLRFPMQPSDLSTENVRDLLSLSYNNLVDWHIVLSASFVRFINNLASDTLDETLPLTQRNTDIISSPQFEARVRNTSIKYSAPACDDCLISIIRRWKKILKAEYRGAVDNRHIATLFNVLILLRGYEDYFSPDRSDKPMKLHSMAILARNGSFHLQKQLDEYLKTLVPKARLSEFVNVEHLTPFKDFDPTTWLNLISDLYRPAQSPYNFNFAVMSKHALSRIYERYVTELDFDEPADAQYSFLGNLCTV